MKLPEVLKHGILTEDWSLICQVYTQITGEHIEPPPKKLYIPTEEEMLANMDIDIPSYPFTINQTEFGSGSMEPIIENISGSGNLSDIIPNYQNSLVNPPPASEKPADSFITSTKQRNPKPQPSINGKRVARTENIQTGPKQNLFVDNGTLESRDLIVNNPQLGKMYQPPKPRGVREQPSFIDVQCSVCGKIVNVNAALAYGYSTDPDDNRFRCDDCLTDMIANRRV